MVKFMEEMIFFDNAKDNVTNFFEKEFENFPPLMMSHFLNKFNDMLNYLEEDRTISPKIVFTDNIEAVNRAIPKSHTHASIVVKHDHSGLLTVPPILPT